MTRTKNFGTTKLGEVAQQNKYYISMIYMAEDAVCLQPVSDPNSLLAGNLAGNFLKKRPPRAILVSKISDQSNVYERIPCSKRAGTFLTEQGILSAE